MWCTLIFVLAASTAHVTLANQTCDCLDIALMIDTSVSINPTEWNQMEQFLQAFVMKFNDPSFDINFAAVNFSKKANLHFNLDTFTTLQDVMVALANIIPQKKSTRHDRALIIVRDDVFTDQGGDRDDNICPDIAIMVTDGRNNTGGDAAAVATELKNAGVTIVSLGIGNNQVMDLPNEISSLNSDGDPMVLHVEDFSTLQLPTVVNDLFNLICPVSGCAVDQTESECAVVKELEIWHRVMNNKNITAATNQYHEDAYLLVPGRSAIIGREAIFDALTLLTSSNDVQFTELGASRVDQLSDNVVADTTFSAKEYRNLEITVYPKAIRIWVKNEQTGRFEIFRNIWNDDLPPQ